MSLHRTALVAWLSCSSVAVEPPLPPQYCLEGNVMTALTPSVSSHLSPPPVVRILEILKFYNELWSVAS